MNIYKNINCSHFFSCSGCSIDKEVNTPPLLSEVGEYFKKKSISFEYFSDKVVGWRCRAKLAIRGNFENPQIGLYEEGTHHVVDIPLCRVHHPSINHAVEQLKGWIRDEKMIPYDEVLRIGLLRYVQCVVERSSGKIQLTLVVNSSSVEKISHLLNRLWVRAPELWHSLWINFNIQPTNAIFGSEWHLIKGEEYVWETLQGIKICFHPANFAQANLDVFECLLKDLKESIIPGKCITEYFAGVGIIGRCLAEKAEQVYCCEIHPLAEKSFKRALQGQNVDNIKFFTGSAPDHLDLLNKSHIAIVDPPRKGLDPALIKALVENNSLEELWYISCGWSSFKRDCHDLLKSWKLNKSKAYLFFPGTDHLEILAHFKKIS